MTGRNLIEVIDFEPGKLDDNKVRVKTLYASGKHGTAVALLDSPNFKNSRFDQEMRIFMNEEVESSLEPSRNNPMNMGTTGVGIVEKVGKNVSKWKPGDEVFGLMDIREINDVDEEWLWSTEGIDNYTALCIEPAYVAFHSLRESNVRFGDRVAIIGLGAIGLIAVKMAVMSGAEQVFAVDKIQKRLELAKDFGADYILNYETEEDPAVRVHELSENKGADVSIEVAGSYQALGTAIRSTRVGGTICSSGFYQGEANSLWLGREWHHNRLTMITPHGCGWGHLPRDYPGWTKHRAYDAIVSLMKSKGLDVGEIINAEITIEQGAEIYKQIKNNPENIVKYVVRF